jgi:quercetin dioxygenase-like cupin family protein
VDQHIGHQIGDLAEVLTNLGVFRMHPEDVIALCPSGFRRVPINQGSDHYLSLQGFAPGQVAYAHTHPDSEEWIVVLRGGGRALLAENPVPLAPGVIIGRAAAHPHGFVSDDGGPLHMISLQVPRPSEKTTTWDQPGETTDPADCAVGERVGGVRGAAGTARTCAPASSSARTAAWSCKSGVSLDGVRPRRPPARAAPWSSSSGP